MQMMTTNGEDIRCGLCGGDALEVTPNLRDDEILYDSWRSNLMHEGKPDAKGRPIVAVCGYCTELTLNRQSNVVQGKTIYEAIKEMRSR